MQLFNVDQKTLSSRSTLQILKQISVACASNATPLCINTLMGLLFFERENNKNSLVNFSAGSSWSPVVWKWCKDKDHLEVNYILLIC